MQMHKADRIMGDRIVQQETPGPQSAMILSRHDSVISDRAFPGCAPLRLILQLVPRVRNSPNRRSLCHSRIPPSDLFRASGFGFRISAPPLPLIPLPLCTTVHQNLRSLRKSLAHRPFGYLRLAIGYQGLRPYRAVLLRG
jgi:hypothetical protein